MLRIWQPFSCCSMLSTASELHLWALAQKMQQYTHLDLVCSLFPGRVSHPFDILVVLKHLEEPHDQPMQWPSAPESPHLSVHVFRPCRHVRWIRRPRECALHAVFIPHSLLAFPLAAKQSMLVVLESQAQHLSPRVCCLDCNCIPYLAGAYLIDDGNIEVAWWCLSIGTRQLWSRDKYNKKRRCPLEMMDITNPLTLWNMRDEENRSIRYLAKDCHLLLLLFTSVVICECSPGVDTFLSALYDQWMVLKMLIVKKMHTLPSFVIFSFAFFGSHFFLTSLETFIGQIGLDSSNKRWNCLFSCTVLWKRTCIAGLPHRWAFLWLLLVRGPWKEGPYFSQFGIVVSQQCRQIQTSKELNAGLYYHRIKLLTLILFGESGLRLWMAYKKIKKPEKVTIPSLRGRMLLAHGNAASYLGGWLGVKGWDLWTRSELK